ncbi:hypothetical protein Q8A67_007251 [Cirrhinus molitorella]|uniref:Phorbol-ester/DAG-type domain-containing protein n=1 Tax=Cirrhinus molitorella TaxID=172907 RepID=A0AA88Q7Y4_9TELE|nr:hypothetical protein Q8A67_007251 [Cirrhinus molitorella]
MTHEDCMSFSIACTPDASSLASCAASTSVKATSSSSPEQPSSPATSSSSPEQPSSPDPKKATSSSSPEQPSSPDPKKATSSSSPVQPSSPDPKKATSSSSPEQPSSPDPKKATSSSSPVQPSSPDPKKATSSSSPEQPSSPDPKKATSSSSPEQPSSPDPKKATSSSSPEQPSSPATSSFSPEQPSSPDPKKATSSSSPVQPSSPDPKKATSSSSPEQPSSPDPKKATSSSSPQQPSSPVSLSCHASSSAMSSSQLSETLLLKEMHLRPSRKRRYSGSAFNDSDISDYSDVDYVPQISSNESDGSTSEHDVPESCSEAGGSSERCKTTLPSKRMKGQTKETDTSPKKRTFYCIYCSKPYSKLARHLKFVHRNEAEVAKAVAFPKHSEERRVQLNILRKRGNFAHSTDVVRKGHGQMIACYRPKKAKNTKDFIHCAYCQGLYNKRSLWKHIKNCPLKPENDNPQGRKRVRSFCALKTPVGLEVSKDFKKILSFMNYDDVSCTIHSDTCIMQLGEHMFNRMGTDVTKHDYIRQKMREVGRLLLEARKITPLRTMADFIIPANFKHVISAVKVVSGFDEETNSYRIPSLALKLVHSLNKICSIVERNAMMYGDHERAECARDFRKVHQARWNEYISAGALTTLKEAKWNAPQIIPFTQDVKFLNKLRNSPSAENYAALAKVTLSQVILFNRQREGEVSRMLLSSFQSRDSSELHEDIAICLSEFERKLCNHFTRVEIRGKRGRKVPVLLKPSLVSAMELLVKTHEVCGVPAQNPFIFARSGAMSAYRGGECVRRALLNLDENEADQLAHFLCHDIRIHRQYYRLPEGMLQLAKMSKVLMAMEKGTLSNFKGKRLDDTEIDPNEQLEEPDDSISSDEEEADAARCSDIAETTAPADTDQVTPNTQMSSDNNGCGAVTVGVDETLCEVESATLEMNTLSKSEVQDKEKVLVVVMFVSVSDPSVLMHSSICAASEGLEKVTPEKDQLPFNDQDSSEKDISPVKVPVLNEKQSFCAPTEAVEEVCKHKVVTSAISSMDKCSVCVGPVAAMKWFGLRCKLCSCFWHKSCYAKLHEWNGKESLQEVSSEEDELSDEEYIPESESENQSDSSEELQTRPSYDKTKLLSYIQKAASYKSSEAFRSDVPAPNVSKGKGKGVLKAREAACMYEESDLLCNEEQLIDVETDSDSDINGEGHNPRKQGSEVCSCSEDAYSENLCSSRYQG